MKKIVAGCVCPASSTILLTQLRYSKIDLFGYYSGKKLLILTAQIFSPVLSGTKYNQRYIFLKIPCFPIPLISQQLI